MMNKGDLIVKNVTANDKRVKDNDALSHLQQFAEVD